MLLLLSLRKNAESTAEEKQKATAEVLNRLRANLTKDGEAVDLSKLTAEEVTAAVMKTISEAGIPEEMLSSLGISFLDLLNALKEPDHDE